MSLVPKGRVPKVYALADVDALSSRSLSDDVKRMVAAGIEWIQIRAKAVEDRELAAQVETCCRAVEGTRVILWVNDRPDVARIFPVGGVHLGQDDLSPEAARAVVGTRRLLGRSTHDDAQVREADADRAVDVIAIGPVFSTTGKRDPDPAVGLEGVRRARRATAKPLVAIGGVGESNLGEVLDAGADCAAMLGAVCTGDVEANCRRLLARAGGLR